MSRIRANKITNKLGTGAVELEKGAHLPIGMGITGAGGLNITGVITATSFSGSGASLTGIDATAIKDPAGNVKIQAQASGAVYTGIHTFGTNTNFTDVDVDGHTNLDNVNVAGVATFASAVNTGALTASTGTFSGNVSIGGTLTYEDVTNIDSVGLITAREGIRLADDKKIILGTGGDFEIYHDTASRSGVRFTNPEFRLMAAGGTGNIQFGVSNSATELSYSTLMAEFKKGAECTLRFNGSPKLATSNTGITVTGTVAATAYTGDGSGLSGVSVGITTEALVKTNGQTASLDLTKDDHKVTATGTVTIDVTGGSEAESHTLRIVNSGIATVGFSTYFLFPSGGTPSLPTTSGAISLISFTVHRAGAVGVSTQLLSGASVNFS